MTELKYYKYHDDKIDQPDFIKGPLTIDFVPYGPGLVTHNMPCFVCFDAPAVSGGGAMEPCWKCQDAGYKVVHEPKLTKKQKLVKFGWSAFRCLIWLAAAVITVGIVFGFDVLVTGFFYLISLWS